MRFIGTFQSSEDIEIVILLQAEVLEVFVPTSPLGTCIVRRWPPLHEIRTHKLTFLGAFTAQLTTQLTPWELILGLFMMFGKLSLWNMLMW